MAEAGLAFARQIYIDDKLDYYDFANETVKQTGAEAMEARTAAETQ
jgi:hypothetical protein